MNELFIKRMKELLKNDFDAFINSLNENEVKGFYLNPLKKDVLNHLNHQYIEKGQTLIVYSGQVTETEIQTMITQLAQLDKQIMDLETLKQGIVKDVQTFVSTDEFGYQSSLGSYLSQREVMQKEHDKVNANISLQNETVVSTQKAISDEITALTAKIAVKKISRLKKKIKKDKRLFLLKLNNWRLISQV